MKIFVSIGIAILLNISSFYIANAIEIDCCESITSIEKLICSDPKLNNLKVELIEAYKLLIRQLEKEPMDLKEINSSQREWLNDLEKIGNAEVESSQLKKSLSIAYAARIEELNKAIAKSRPTITEQGYFIREALNNELISISRKIKNATRITIIGSKSNINSANACSELVGKLMNDLVEIPGEAIFEALNESQVLKYMSDIKIIAKQYFDKSIRKGVLPPEAKAKIENYEWSPDPIKKALDMTKKYYEKEWKEGGVQFPKGLVHLAYPDLIMSTGDPSLILVSIKLKTTPKWQVSWLQWSTLGSDGRTGSPMVFHEEGRNAIPGFINAGLMKYQNKILVWKLSKDEDQNSDYILEVYGLFGLLNKSIVDQSCTVTFN